MCCIFRTLPTRSVNVINTSVLLLGGQLVQIGGDVIGGNCVCVPCGIHIIGYGCRSRHLLFSHKIAIEVSEALRRSVVGAVADLALGWFIRIT